MFYIHYINFIELGEWYNNITEDYYNSIEQLNITVTLSLNMLAMFHYKFPYQLSMRALEGQLPIETNSFQLECKHYNNLNDFLYVKINNNYNKLLKNNYQKRINNYNNQINNSNNTNNNSQINSNYNQTIDILKKKKQIIQEKIDWVL